MTENEIKEFVAEIRQKSEIFRNSGFATTGITNVFDKSADIIEELLPYMAIGTVEQLEWCKDASHWKELFKDKLEQYEAIGTVEDIRNTHLLCEVFSNTVRDYTTIGTIDEFKAYKQGNCTNDCKHYDSAIEYVRNKAIDEFAEMLKEKYEEHNLDLCLRQNDYYSYANSCIQLENYIDKIAEQMKAGGKNES